MFNIKEKRIFYVFFPFFIYNNKTIKHNNESFSHPTDSIWISIELPWPWNGKAWKHKQNKNMCLETLKYKSLMILIVHDIQNANSTVSFEKQQQQKKICGLLKINDGFCVLFFLCVCRLYKKLCTLLFH